MNPNRRFDRVCDGVSVLGYRQTRVDIGIVLVLAMSTAEMTPNTLERETDKELNWVERMFNHDIEGNVDVDGTPVGKDGSFQWSFNRFWSYAGPGVRKFETPVTHSGLLPRDWSDGPMTDCQPMCCVSCFLPCPRVDPPTHAAAGMHCLLRSSECIVFMPAMTYSMLHLFSSAASKLHS